MWTRTNARSTKRHQVLTVTHPNYGWEKGAHNNAATVAIERSNNEIRNFGPISCTDNASLSVTGARNYCSRSRTIIIHCRCHDHRTSLSPAVTESHAAGLLMLLRFHHFIVFILTRPLTPPLTRHNALSVDSVTAQIPKKIAFFLSE